MAKYLYGYHEERGFADLYVTDRDGKTVWEAHYPSFYESNGEMMEENTIFEDGFMKNASDIEGLESYLKSISVINKGDELVDVDSDDDDDDDDDDADDSGWDYSYKKAFDVEYAAGGTIEAKIKKRLKNAFELPIQIAVYVPSTRDKDIIITKREMEARVEDVQRFLANAFGGFSAVKVEGGFESSDKGLIQEDAVRVVAFASKENEKGIPFEQSFESLMYQVKNWCSKWSQQSIGVEFENDLFYVDSETKFGKGGEVDLAPYKDIQKLNMLYKSGSKWYAWGSKYKHEATGEGYTKKEALQDLDNHLSYATETDEFADGGLTWYKYDNNIYESRLGDFDIMIYPETQRGYWSVYVLEGKNKVGAEFDVYGIKNAKDKAYSIIKSQYMEDGGEVEDEVYNAYVVWIDDNDEAFFDGGWWSIEDAEDRVSDIEWEEEGKTKYKVFAVEYDEDYFENKNWDITRMKSYRPYGSTSYKKGGTTEDVQLNDIVWFREEKGNFFVEKDTVYAWLYDDPKAAEKLESDEYDYVLFPPSGGIGLISQRGYVPPLQRIWTKKYQNKTKGSDRLIGIVQGWYDEENKKLYIDMMTTRKDMRRKGVNSHIIRELRKELGLEREQVEFVNTTQEGEKFSKSSKYEYGGYMAKGGKVKPFDIFEGDVLVDTYNGDEYKVKKVDKDDNIIAFMVIHKDKRKGTKGMTYISNGNLSHINKRIADGDLIIDGTIKEDGGYMAKGGGFNQYGEPYGYEESESDSVYEIHHKPNYNSKNPYLIWDKIDGVYIAEFPNRQRALHYIYNKSLGMMEDGGSIAEGNAQMLRSNAKAIKHHAEELEQELNENPEVEAWVVAKGERAATDLSDITHYLDGRKFSHGGDIEHGVDLFEDYEAMPVKVLKVLGKYDLESGDYRELEKALKDLNSIGYTFEYELDGEPYDLRKIGQKGKSEFYAKGGSIKSLEKRVAEVNELIKRGNDLGIEVVDESTTWQAPMKYKPLKYTNGVLYISYEVLDLYNYSKTYSRDWEKKSYKIGKYESRNIYGYQGEAGAAQREALTEIARMYRKPLKSYDTYGYFEDGGEVNKVNPEEMKAKIEDILNKVVPSFYKGVSIYKNIFDTGNNIRIFIAASDYKINNVAGQLPQVVSLSLDLSDMDLHPQVFGGNGGRAISRKPNMSDPDEKYLAMKSVKVPFRTPQPNEKAVLDAIKRFAENYKKTLAENREVLLYQDIVDYDKLLAGSQFADGGEIYSLAENMTDAEYEKKLSSLNVKQKRTYESLVRLGDSPKLALATTLLSNEVKYSQDTTRGYTMAMGGTFASGVKAIEKRLVGTKVNPKYQKEYGKTYDKAEAHEAASKIKGKMRAMELADKYKKKKLAKGGTIQDEYDKLRKIEDDARNSYYRAKDLDKWYNTVGNNYILKWEKQVAKLKKLDGFEPNYDFGDVIA